MVSKGKAKLLAVLQARRRLQRDGKANPALFKYLTTLQLYPALSCERRGHWFIHWFYMPRQADALSPCEIFHINMLRRFGFTSKVKALHIRCAYAGPETAAMQEAKHLLGLGGCEIDFQIVAPKKSWEHDTYKECVEFAVATGEWVSYTHFKGVSHLGAPGGDISRPLDRTSALDLFYWCYLMYYALATAPGGSQAVGPLRVAHLVMHWIHREPSWSRCKGHEFHYSGSFQAFSGTFLQQQFAEVGLGRAERERQLWTGDQYVCEVLLSLLTREEDVYSIGSTRKEQLSTYRLYSLGFMPELLARFEEVPPQQCASADPKIYVGLTSWAKRIHEAHLTIESILNQSRPPDSVELNLDFDNFPKGESDLPESILALKQHKNFHIFFQEHDWRAWQKSAPTIKRHLGENYILFTLDDDCTYSRDYIKDSLMQFDNYPHCAFMNTQRTSAGFTGETMAYRSIFCNSIIPYLKEELCSQVKLDDLGMLLLSQKFDTKQAPVVPKPLYVDRVEGYSLRRLGTDDGRGGGYCD